MELPLMKFSKLLSYISEEELAFLSVETNVDQQVKKLKGIVMFKLLLYSLLESNKPSLRVLEQYFNSSKFQFLANTSKLNTKYNSISDRLTTINSDYFERIFNLLFEKYCTLLKQTKSIQIYDSTMVGLSSKLVDWSMRLGRRTNKVQLKFTVGIQGGIILVKNVETKTIIGNKINGVMNVSLVSLELHLGAEL